MEDITNTDYAHAKIVCKDFEEYHKYHDLNVQSDTLLLANVKNMSLTLVVFLLH